MFLNGYWHQDRYHHILGMINWSSYSRWFTCKFNLTNQIPNHRFPECVLRCLISSQIVITEFLTKRMIIRINRISILNLTGLNRVYGIYLQIKSKSCCKQFKLIVNNKKYHRWGLLPQRSSSFWNVLFGAFFSNVLLWDFS